MDTFDSHYSVEIKELIFPEYNKNKFIVGQMVYVLGGDNKHSIILVRDLNS